MWAAHLGRRSQGGSTALICAAIKGRADCVRLLLDAGADKNAKDLVRASAVVASHPQFSTLLVFRTFHHKVIVN